MGVLLFDGVTELGVSGIVDPLESSFARTFVVAPERAIVQSRNGFLFVRRYDFSNLPTVDRVVVAAGENDAAKQQALAAWSTARPWQLVEDVYRTVGSGETAYDATLRYLARTRGVVMAHLVADIFLYPTVTADLSEASVLPTELLVVALLCLVAAALVYTARRVRAQRRIRVQPAPQPA